MGILYACNPKVHMGPILVASPGEAEPSQGTSDPDIVGIRAGIKRVWSQAQPLPPTSQCLQLEHKIQQMQLLQTNRVASLVQLSVRAVRDTLAGTIELNVQSLLHDHPPQQQRILRTQIMLDDILGVNALQGVEEAFTTAEALEQKLGKERPWFGKDCFIWRSSSPLRLGTAIALIRILIRVDLNSLKSFSFIHFPTIMLLPPALAYCYIYRNYRPIY